MRFLSFLYDRCARGEEFFESFKRLITYNVKYLHTLSVADALVITPFESNRR